MQFDGNDSHVSDPRAELENLDLGTFDVDFQQVDGLNTGLTHDRIHRYRADPLRAILDDLKGSLGMGFGRTERNLSVLSPESSLNRNDRLVGGRISDQCREVRALGLDSNDSRRRVFERE